MTTWTSYAVLHHANLPVSVQVLDGPHFFAFGDHGGVVAAVTQFGTTKEIK